MNHDTRFLYKTEPLTFQQLVTRIVQKTNSYPKPYKNGFRMCCPVHDDRHPSFSISQEWDGKILMHCFSGCSFSDICNVLGVKKSDLFPQKQWNTSW